MRRVLIVMLCLIWSEQLFAQSQPQGVILAGSIPKVLPPFDTSGWVLTKGAGRDGHTGDDYYAQDWARNCHSQGQKLYAGISGQVHLEPVGNGVFEAYGNSVVIVDEVAGFAQRYAHMQDFAPGLRQGDLVLAGQFVGRVGFTGNVQPSSACSAQGGRGAHAHIVLYQNVSSRHSRPVGSVSTFGGATSHAANFGYNSPVPLAKADNDQAVYAVVNGQREFVTAFVFDNQGLNFDRYRAVFDPLANAMRNPQQIYGLSQQSWYFAPRNGSLIKDPHNDTVYLVQDGMRKGLPGWVFGCRGFRYEEIHARAENFLYPPRTHSLTAQGCVDEQQQALRDLVSAGNTDWRLDQMHTGTYTANLNWSPDWELRYVHYEFRSNRRTFMYHATNKHNPNIRYYMFWDLDSNAWSNNGWARIY